ncbi:hypothetical protein K438DRAFT_1999291 [Mycena galopus ATCC 62051]|nr:hypothetical protein K438DRAFT_1999291 [Mycena galopus ATCC 62051]
MPGDKNTAPSLALSTSKVSHIYCPAPAVVTTSRMHRVLIYHKARSTQRSSALNFCPDPIKLSKSLRLRKIPQANASLRKSVRGGISAPTRLAPTACFECVPNAVPFALTPPRHVQFCALPQFYDPTRVKLRRASPSPLTLAPEESSKWETCGLEPACLEPACLEPACLEVIVDQDGKDLALAIHGRGIRRKHWAITGVEVGLPPYSLPAAR